MFHVRQIIDGPLVVVAPPKMYGGTLDMWQRSVVEIGPAGPDRGQDTIEELEFGFPGR